MVKNHRGGKSKRKKEWHCIVIDYIYWYKPLFISEAYAIIPTIPIHDGRTEDNAQPKKTDDGNTNQTEENASGQILHARQILLVEHGRHVFRKINKQRHLLTRYAILYQFVGGLGGMVLIILNSPLPLPLPPA
jgi:hypothetical protein